MYLTCLLAISGLASDTSLDLAPQVHVSGNKLVNSDGQPVVLHGVDRSGTEYECVQGQGIFDGPSGQASVNAMHSWGINAVRIPLNEACWNGQSYVKRADAGRRYRIAIENYVSLLNDNGMIAILDLHWTDGRYTGNSQGCSSWQAICQKPMPDTAQSIPFWSSIAAAFKDDDSVIFDLFNEPYPDRVMRIQTAWQCWRNGGAQCAPAIPYPVAGMQTLINTVRATGSNNVIMVGGLAYANNLTGWLAHRPFDPIHNLAASWHSYSFNACSSPYCWSRQITPVIAKVPVIAGEIGEKDCSDHYIRSLMHYLDSKATSYLAWSWNVGPECSPAAKLITGYSGKPNRYGSGFEDHLKSLMRQS